MINKMEVNVEINYIVIENTCGTLHFTIIPRFVKIFKLPNVTQNDLTLNQVVFEEVLKCAIIFYKARFNVKAETEDETEDDFEVKKHLFYLTSDEMLDKKYEDSTYFNAILMCSSHLVGFSFKLIQDQNEDTLAALPQPARTRLKAANKVLPFN